MDLFSFLLGLACVPAAATTWYTLWHIKNMIVRVVERPDPENLPARVQLASRVFGSRRVVVANFTRITMAVTLGRARHEQQRAAMVLSGEFNPDRRVGSFW